ncbi:MAG TPA: hypothetical protein DCG75_05785 [Bacteroidales bacterium]|jgi:hypothetical protein|nr:hypothetical protein [Bacteroidales bacterium]
MIDLKQHSLYKPMEADSVISTVFNIYFKRFWVLFFTSFVAAFLIQTTFYQLGFFELTKLTDQEELIEMIVNMRKEILVGSIVYFILYGSLISFLINFLIKVDLNPLSNLTEIFIETIKGYSIHIIFFLIISMIIVVIGSSIGLLVFIVGVIAALLYLGTILIPGSTIIIVENKNAIEAIGRSFKLVHKDFWSILGALLLFILAIILISILLSAVTVIPYIIAFFDNWHEANNIKDIFNLKTFDIGFWSVVINSFVSAITYPLYAILSLVVYFKLKYLEDKHFS